MTIRTLAEWSRQASPPPGSVEQLSWVVPGLLVAVGLATDGLRGCGPKAAVGPVFFETKRSCCISTVLQSATRRTVRPEMMAKIRFQMAKIVAAATDTANH